jgi:putative spermidine/putrescine transport system substrate-binding protein
MSLLNDWRCTGQRPIWNIQIRSKFNEGEKRDMRTNKFVFQMLALLVVAATLLTACGGAPTEPPVVTEAPATEAPATEAPATEAPVDPMAELVAAAQAEGMLTTIALPDDWCNYREVIDAFKAKYGIEVNELNPDASSGDEIEAIKANKDNTGPQAPDVVDVGFSFGEPNKDLFMPYKVSTWDTILDESKSADGFWYGDYYGVMAFLVNTDVQPDVPQDWADLLDPKYKGQIALSGDPRGSNQAIQAVQAAALGNGGSLDNAQAGLDFFAQLNTVGNLIPLIANNGLVAKGEIPVRITWDYNGLAAIDSFAGNPKAELVIPKTGQFAGMYVQAISAYAPHPNAAKLWMEFLYSDEGQLLYLKGYCHPAREADMRARGVIPADMLAKLPDVSGAVFPTAAQLIAAKELITTTWDSVVGADIQKPPQ